MAQGSTFQDSQGTDFIGQQQSLMERSQAMRLREQSMALQQQQAEQQRAEFQAKLPAIIAKRDADVLTARASIANATRMETLRSQAAASSVDYNGEFLNIMNIPDSKTRSDELGLFMGKVAWLDNPALPEYQGFAKAVREERAKSFAEATTNFKLDQHLDELQINVEAKRADAAKRAQTAIEVASIRANAPSATQKLIDAYEEAKNSGADAETIAALKGAIDRTTTRAAQASAVERAIANRDSALAAGDRAKAQVFQDEINKATSFASDPIKNPLPASTAKVPANTAPFKEIKLQSGATVKLRETTAK